MDPLALFALSAAGLRASVERAACGLFPPLCFFPESGWIAWNLCLAAIPLLASLWLFRRRQRSRSPLWWGVFLIYLGFLPNAPYLLTDIIHSVKAARLPYSAWIIILFIIPMHIVAIVGGFQAYVFSLINQEYYLVRQGKKWLVGWAELITHGLCALGIYLGRFDRLNSWDLVQNPSDVAIHVLNTLTARRPVLVVVLTFLIISVLYWLMKQITLGLGLRLRQLRSGLDYDGWLQQRPE